MSPIPSAPTGHLLSTVSLAAALTITGCVHAPCPREAASDCARARSVEESPQDAPRAALTRFLDGVEAGDWNLAWSLLSEPLRIRYTPERLREDFERDPLAAERLRRARLVVRGPVRLTGTGAEFPLGGERAVRLEREAGEYRVAAIE